MLTSPLLPADDAASADTSAFPAAVGPGTHGRHWELLDIISVGKLS